MTSLVEYKGDLRTFGIPLKSGKSYITDAPTDNHGKGEAFSPTDLISTALASYMLTLMDIRSTDNQIKLGKIKAEITKHMDSNPRKIKAIDVYISFDGTYYSIKEKMILEKAALTCPATLSLNPDIKQNVIFEYG